MDLWEYRGLFIKGQSITDVFFPLVVHALMQYSHKNHLKNDAARSAVWQLDPYPEMSFENLGI